MLGNPTGGIDLTREVVTGEVRWGAGGGRRGEFRAGAYSSCGSDPAALHDTSYAVIRGRVKVDGTVQAYLPPAATGSLARYLGRDRTARGSDWNVYVSCTPMDAMVSCVYV